MNRVAGTRDVLSTATTSTMTGAIHTIPLSSDNTPPLPPPVLLRLPGLVGAAVVLDHSGASVRILAAYSRHTAQILQLVCACPRQPSRRGRVSGLRVAMSGASAREAIGTYILQVVIAVVITNRLSPTRAHDPKQLHGAPVDFI